MDICIVFMYIVLLVYLSRNGSVPVMESDKLVPRTRTPQRCSVAYCISTCISGNDGNLMFSVKY